MTKKPQAFLCILLFVLLAACGKAPGEATPTAVPVAEPPSPTATATIDPTALAFAEISEQVTFQGQPFFPLQLYTHLRFRDYPAEEMSWRATGNERLAVDLADGEALITPQDPGWLGSETIHFEACEPDGTCAVRAVVFTVIPQEGALKITYTCNEGFILEAGGRKILVDALLQESGIACLTTAGEEEAQRNGLPPFDGVALVLVTHDDYDHFDAGIAGEYLQNNPEAMLVTDARTVETLRVQFPAFDQVEDRILSVTLEPGDTTQMTVQGIDLEVIISSPDRHSLGFIIRVGGYTLFHTGDANDDPVEMAAYFQSLGLPDKGIDIAFVPWGYLGFRENQPILAGIGAGQYVPMHIGQGNDYAYRELQANYPQAILFESEMQSWWSLQAR